MAPSTPPSKKPSSPKKPKKQFHKKTLKEGGITPDALDVAIIAGQSSGKIISAAGTGIDNSTGKIFSKAGTGLIKAGSGIAKVAKKAVGKRVECQPDPKLEGKGKPHDHYEPPDGCDSLQSANSGLQ